MQERVMIEEIKVYCHFETIATTKANRNYSLFIDSVELPRTGGHIGMTSCPGKQDEFFLEPQAQRLEADVRAIREWGASVVVTLIDDNEIEALQVRDLGATLAAQGLRWLHLPIRNRALPGPEFEEQWSRAGKELRAILEEGGRILLHCREGVGRTGIIAARLLIEMGVATAEAVRAVRKARLGALETLLHEGYCNSLVQSGALKRV
jgi:protein-tyrosine phosphatase